MSFRFSAQGLSGRQKFLQRIFEILPGFTSWFVLLGLAALSFWKPLAAAILIIAFVFYWLLRLFYMTLFLVVSYLRLSIDKGADWMGRIRELDPLGGGAAAPRAPEGVGSLAKTLSFVIHQRKLEQLLKKRVMPPASSQIYHLVMFPVFNETPDVIEPGIIGVLNQTYPVKNVLFVIAVEERSAAQVKAGAAALREKYRDRFMEFWVVEHPDGIAGEARVKGANVTHAAKRAAEFFSQKGIPFSNVIASCFDADTVVEPDYFACLTYHYMICPERTRASFQPIPVYHNNIWDVPGFARVLEMGSSFFQLVEATNSEKLVTFSSHSMSFQALVEAGYWPVDMISDDSAIFWKAYLHYDGDYRVVPMYVTVSMDVVAADSWWKTIRNVYRQKRRWAWGVENFPIVMRGFLANSKIPVHLKLMHGFKLFEGHIAWATWAFILTFISWLPGFFAGRDFSGSVLYYSGPRVTGTIFNLASLAFFTTAVLALCLLPKSKGGLIKKIIFVSEWFFVPFIVTFLSALPAIDAQTRLMLGKYMAFWVTDKKRPPSTVV